MVFINQGRRVQMVKLETGQAQVINPKGGMTENVIGGKSEEGSMGKKGGSQYRGKRGQLAP